MVLRVTGGKPLPAEVVQQIVVKTDGIPLFVEELVKTVLESGLVREDADRYVLTGPLPPLAIPTTLQDALMARLDRLAAVKEVAQLGAVLGREFAYTLLRAVTPLEEPTLQQSLAQLSRPNCSTSAAIPRRRPTSLSTPWCRMPPISRCCGARGSSTTSALPRCWRRSSSSVETQPELLAHHYTEAGLAEQAIIYWQRAGQQASDRSAHVEAVSHCTTGIALLKTLPETPARTQQSLTLHITLGAALLVTKGQSAPEVEHAYTQAHALCQQVGETPELVPVLYGLWRFYVLRPQLHTACELAETLLHLAHRTDDPALAVIAHYALGTTWLWRGALPAARSASGGRHRPLHARPAPYAGVPHGPRSGSCLPSLCRLDPLVAGVPVASPGLPPRGLGVGARAGASRQSGVCAVSGGFRLSAFPGRASRARAGRGRRRTLD